MAKFFLDSGEFYWNSGMFIWTAKSILNAFRKYDPETCAVFEAGAGSFGTPQEMEFINEAFPSAPSISIDYAIMEKAGNVYVKTADLGWSDLGSWNALYESSPKNQNGNVTQNCKVLAHDCEHTIFAVEGDRIVVAAGLKDYIVAEAGSALLICPRSDEQKIRQIVNDVKSRFGEKYI
jgi:mannose-1-phosphate guanylyltransferase